MTVPTRYSIEQLRVALAVPEDVLAVNAGTRGPMSAAAWAAMMAAHEEDRSIFGVQPTYLEGYESIPAADRVEVARLVNCDPDDVGLCESTTTAMNILLWGCDLRPGDEVIATSLENPAAVVPLRVFARRNGLALTIVDVGNGDGDVADAVASRVSDRTRVVLVSDVNFATGTRFDLTEISRIAHEHGALVFADGVQATGTCPVDVGALGVDGYALARHKFLCGPEGAGALFLSPAVRDRVQPTFVGVFSDASHGGAADLDLYAGPRRYEVSTRSLPTTVGATAGLRWLADEVGWAVIHAWTAQRVLETRAAVAGVPGVRMLGSDEPGGGLVAFSVDGLDPVDLVPRLTSRHVLCRPVLITDPPCVRLSIGFWNRPTDAEGIAAAIRAVV